MKETRILLDKFRKEMIMFQGNEKEDLERIDFWSMRDNLDDKSIQAILLVLGGFSHTDRTFALDVDKVYNI